MKTIVGTCYYVNVTKRNENQLDHSAYLHLLLFMHTKSSRLWISGMHPAIVFMTIEVSNDAILFEQLLIKLVKISPWSFKIV